MWGVFRIKRPLKHEPEIINTLEAVYCNPEEALLTLKNQDVKHVEDIIEVRKTS